MRNKVELDIVALSHSLTQSHNYAVVLGERDGNRRLPIVIGGFEAQAIAVAMERMTPSRPLTHDLMKNILQEYEVELKEVIVSDLVDGIFHARLVCMKEGDIVEIDSRTSDALAMAVRFDCPIYTYEFILEAAGIVLDEEEQEEKPKRPRRKRQKVSLANMPVDDLEKMLQEVLEKEDYEKAAKIRDELNKRQSN